MEPQRAPTWKIVLATALDLVTSFWLFGLGLSTVLGERTASGFRLSGLPALLLVVLIIAYFIIGRRYAGGTLWDRFFGIPRRRP